MRRAAVHPVWLVSAGLAAAAAILYVILLDGVAAPGTPFELPWWALVALFCAADASMVHVQFRRDAHSFMLSEIPLVLGLFFAAPSTLVLARLAGALIALVLIRRLPPIKLAFNAALFALDTCVAIAVFRSIAGDAAAMDARGALAALAATLVASLLGVALVVVAISLSERAVRVEQLPRQTALGAIVTAANASIALLGVSILADDPRLAWLLLVPAGVLFLAYRAYVSEGKKRERLEFLYETASMLHRSHDLGGAMQGLLQQARKVFRAEVAEIVLLPRDGTEGLRTTLGPGQAVEVLQPVDRSALDGLLTRVASGRSRDAMIAPLVGERGVVGTLLVGQRLREPRTFDSEDFQLFEALVNHAGLSLELIELGEDLAHQARHDALTGLPNWALLRERLTEALAAGTPDPVAVLVLDLDDFKTVNDSLGHAAGDELLVGVTARLLAVLRGQHLAARLGGDEFAVLVERAGERTELAALANRIAAALRPPFTLDRAEVAVTGSIGIAVSGELAEDAGSLLRNADLAMYRAKSDGKGASSIFEASLHDAALNRLQMKADLRAALDRRELALAFQPIVDLASGEIAGAEALVRWEHPQRGAISPADFVPLAEETGLIASLGQWVLEEALREAVAWPSRARGAARTVSVNVSVAQVQRPAFLDEVAAALFRTSLEPERLVLEITESVFMEDAEAMAAQLRRLKDLGVRLALDDFGTGYSSLGYLARFPIDTIKVDKIFVDGIARADEDAALVEAVVRMSDALGLATVAEGVETLEQRDHLRSLGCELAQGFLFARPLPADALRRLLRAELAPAPAAKVVALRSR